MTDTLIGHRKTIAVQSTVLPGPKGPAPALWALCSDGTIWLAFPIGSPWQHYPSPPPKGFPIEMPEGVQ